MSAYDNLKRKALKCAVTALDNAHEKAEARAVYIRWKVFHNEKAFIDAVERKRKEFKK